MSTENSPLLSNEKDCNLHDEQSSETREADRQASYVTVPPIGLHELPPPYTPSPLRVPVITCEVCGFMIDLTGRWGQHVIKCSSCNEATPIKSAPPDKKYVRCQCNCLLICKSTSQRILCPRNDCSKLINLIPVQTTYPSNLPRMCQLTCAYCENRFMFNAQKLFDCCPYCNRVSSIGQKYSVSLGNKCVIAAFVMLIISVGLAVGTYSYAAEFGGLYILYLGLFTVSIVLFFKSMYYFTMKTSMSTSVSVQDILMHD